jgi:hypothetical protein
MTLKVLQHPTSKKHFKMGRQRPRARGPRLSLKNYLMKHLPAAPHTIDFSKPAMSALQLVYMNDQLGDCTIAGAGHVVGTLTGGAGKVVTFTDDQIVAMYSACGGYVPGQPNTDQGCDEQTVLNYWMSPAGGIGGGNQIAGWLAVDGTNPEEYRTALWLFENLYFGVELPDAWVNPMPSESGFTWTVAGNADPSNGHCFVGVGYDTKGVKIDTWGMLGTLTDEAVKKYATTEGSGELYVVISQEGIAKASQKAPNGFDWSQLVADFDSMGGNLASVAARLTHK